MTSPAAHAGDGGEGSCAPAIADLVERLLRESGFPAHAVDAARIVSHLRARAASLGLARPDDTDERAVAAMLRLVNGDRGEFMRLESIFSPPETWLFRYPESFEFVRDLVRRHAERRERDASPRTPPRLRALVVGAGGWCEPCSLAAAILEGIRCGSPWPTSDVVVEIEATDRSPEVFAQPPRFRDMQVRAGIPAWAAAYFERDGDAIRATAATRAPISTRIADDLRVHADAAASGARWDIVLFRNVAIYLDDARRTRAYRALSSMLAPGGALLVGHSEVHLAAQATGLSPAAHASSFALLAPVEPRHVGEPRAFESRGAEPRTTASRTTASRPGEPSAVTTGLRSTQPDPRATPAERTAGASESRSIAPPERPSAWPSVVASAGAFVEKARELAAQGDARGAEHAVSRALYLDLRHEAALLLAAEFAERRGAGAEAERFRERALRAHLAREEERPRSPDERDASNAPRERDATPP